MLLIRLRLTGPLTDNGAHGPVPLFNVDLFQPREALIHIVEEGLGIVDEHPGRVQPTALDLVSDAPRS